ncbi:MAG TPA: hypothetical protein DD490_30565 [Acidobacteria bacterium]|nr:hypothetical protein [Acidobacteriota bacterium]
MICPECGLEYEASFAMCEACGVLLEDEESDEIEDVDFAPLVESTDVTWFGVVTESLEEMGIPWFVQAETSLGVLSREGGDVGRAGDAVVTVYVAENRCQEARRIVHDLRAVGTAGA